MVRGSRPLTGTVSVPGDKSISHRSVLLGALAQGDTTVENYLPGDDCLHTIECLRRMGADISVSGTCVVIRGKGPTGLKEPDDVLNVGNSGTAIRLMLGLISGLKLYCVLSGDESIRRRPMDRVVEPLRMMGAQIQGRLQGRLAPISVLPSPRLTGIAYQLPVASAQVKSAILLAGLFASGETSVVAPTPSRDHTERMLRQFGVTVEESGNKVSLVGGQRLSSTHIQVPGDISSAAFLLVAAAIIPGSFVRVENVGLNPTRTGIISVLKKMGAKLRITDFRDGVEPTGTVEVRSGKLNGVDIGGELIPSLIDEIPILTVAAACAEGTTVIKDAAELRVKETDRIATMCQELAKFGVQVEATPDGMRIIGSQQLTVPPQVCGHGDHRVAMTLSVLAALAGDEQAQPVSITDSGAIATSFPGYVDLMSRLGMNLAWV